MRICTIFVSAISLGLAGCGSNGPDQNQADGGNALAACEMIVGSWAINFGNVPEYARIEKLGALHAVKLGKSGSQDPETMFVQGKCVDGVIEQNSGYTVAYIPERDKLLFMNKELDRLH